MNRCLLLVLIYNAVFSSYLFSQPFPQKIGGNLDGNGGIALEFPNVTYTATAWESVSSPGSPATTDSVGWPLEDFRVVFFDHRPFNAWNGTPDDPQKYVIDLSGTYSLSFTGQANITSWSDAPIVFQNQVYDSLTNKTSLEIVFPPGGGANVGTLGNYGFLMINFLQTNYSTGVGGVKDIRMMRPGYQHNNPQIFRTAYLNALNPFAALRYMNVLNTNNNDGGYPNVRNWSARAMVNDPRYNDGMPWETVIALGNYTGRDLWINIPVDADSLYIVQLDSLMHSTLRSDVNIYLEYSNEVWNGSFTQYQYNYDAVLQSAEDADIRNSTQFDDRRRARRVAKQVIRMGKIFENVFGVTVASRTRIRPVFAWQVGGWLPWYDDVLNWINTTYGQPKDFIYGISSAPYFNENNIPSNATPQQIVAGMSVNSDSNLTRIQTLAQMADQWQLKHLQYEGGPDNGGGSTVNIGNRIMANRIADMKTAVIHNYADNWFSANANGTAPVGTNDLISYFVISANVSRYGCWGAIEDLNYLDSLSYAPKYDALCILSGMCGNEPSVSLTSPVNNTILQANSVTTISANASDVDGTIARVEFFANEIFLGSDSIAPYSIQWTPADSGTFAIMAKSIDNYNKYRFTDANVVEVNSNTTNILENDVDLNFQIYPNPAKNELNLIASMVTGEINFEIRDITGKIVMTSKSKKINEILTLNIAELNSGSYIIRIKYKEHIVNKKLIKL